MKKQETQRALYSAEGAAELGLTLQPISKDLDLSTWPQRLKHVPLNQAVPARRHLTQVYTPIALRTGVWATIFG